MWVWAGGSPVCEDVSRLVNVVKQRAVYAHGDEFIFFTVPLRARFPDRGSLALFVIRLPAMIEFS